MTEVSLQEPSQKELSTYKATATRVKNGVERMTLETEEDYAKAGDFIVVIKKSKKEVEAKKRGILDPLNLAAKRTRDLFRPVESMLDESLGEVQKTMLAFRRKKEEEERAKEEELQKEVEAGEKTTEAAVAEMDEVKVPDKTVQGSKGKTTVRKTKVVEITDESKVPREFLQLDMVKIRQHALGLGDVQAVEIPGVVVKEESNIV